MKPRTKLIALLTAGLAVIAWAALVQGCRTAPPTALERGIFDFRTNYTPVVVVLTNTAWVTNQVVQVVSVTNEHAVVVPVSVTNLITLPRYEVVTLTNLVPSIEFIVGTNAAALRDTAAGIGNVAAPGVGGPIASGVVGLLLAVWAWVRSGRATATAANSTQVIETARELLKRLPDGATYDAALVQWMQKHQAEAGVLNRVLALLESKVNNADAKFAAQQIADAVKALQK